MLHYWVHIYFQNDQNAFWILINKAPSNGSLSMAMKISTWETDGNLDDFVQLYNNFWTTNVYLIHLFIVPAHIFVARMNSWLSKKAVK